MAGLSPRWRRIRAFMARDRVERLLLVEAAAELALARAAVALVPFRVLARRFGTSPDTGTGDPVLIDRVARAVTTAAAHVPFKAVCLPQAIAAKRMLARRGQGSAVHFGIGNNPAKLSAHAWLSVGGTVVVGAAAIATVTSVTRFG